MANSKLRSSDRRSCEPRVLELKEARALARTRVESALCASVPRKDRQLHSLPSRAITPLTLLSVRQGSSSINASTQHVLELPQCHPPPLHFVASSTVIQNQHVRRAGPRSPAAQARHAVEYAMVNSRDPWQGRASGKERAKEQQHSQRRSRSAEDILANTEPERPTILQHITVLEDHRPFSFSSETGVAPNTLLALRGTRQGSGASSGTRLGTAEINQYIRRAGHPSRAARDAEHFRSQEKRRNVLGDGIEIVGNDLADRLSLKMQRLAAFK